MATGFSNAADRERGASREPTRVGRCLLLAGSNSCACPRVIARMPGGPDAPTKALRGLGPFSMCVLASLGGRKKNLRDGRSLERLDVRSTGAHPKGGFPLAAKR